MKNFNDQINYLIEQGKIMSNSSNLEDYDIWKRSVQFFIERNGSPTMIKEVEKEVNRRPIWIAYSSQPKGELDEQFRVHKVENIKSILSLLEAVKSIGCQGKKVRRDSKRQFSQTIKNHVWDRQQGKCLRCKNPLNLISTHYDHIKTWEEGGQSNEENCQALCANCHSIKTNDDRLIKQREIKS